MIRLVHLSGSLQGRVSASPKAVIRIGRSPDCDVRFDAALDSKVSTRHAEIRFEDGAFLLVDIGSSNGTLLNGKRIARPMKLRDGDVIAFGQEGPEARFSSEPDLGVTGGRAVTRSVTAGVTLSVTPAPPALDDANAIAKAAQQKIAQARAMSGGQASGQTMFIMADTVQKAQTAATDKASRRYGKVILIVVAIALLVSGSLGFIVWDQNQQLEQIAERKNNADKQIQKIQLQMQLESDPDRLNQLEAELSLLTGKAQQAIGEMEQKDKSKAAELTNQGDDLDREIKRILRKFDADTYSVPPIFKERLKFYIAALAHSPSTKGVWARKKLYWPMILKEFAALGLPEETAYVAWQESRFIPSAMSEVGARGMWQFMEPVARQYGLRVDKNWKEGGTDERLDESKETKIAARYLYNLLCEFGEESFMLAIASYNKGENGMRTVLHRAGFHKDERDFWHLYRLHMLPDETMEYVPQILAEAIVGNNPQKYGLEP